MRTSSEKFYDRFFRLYPIIDCFLKPQKKKFFEHINALPYGHVLEIGIGNGSNLSYYKTHHITGIDTSAGMLAQARMKANIDTQLLQMNGEALTFPNESFDYVILSHVVAVVGNPERLLAEAHRVLRANGKLLILNHFTPNNYLRYLDKAVASLVRLVHVKSSFRADSLDALRNFKLIEEFSASAFSYFKILIYEKNV